jgi:hypothetical protein
LIVTALVLASALAGTGASTKPTNSKQGQPACKRCSPAFPGSIPHCGTGGSGSGGTTAGGGGGKPGG